MLQCWVRFTASIRKYANRRRTLLADEGVASAAVNVLPLALCVVVVRHARAPVSTCRLIKPPAIEQHWSSTHPLP